MCELLNAEKFQNSSNFLHSIGFDHNNKKVSANVRRLTKSIVASMLCIYVFARAKTFFLPNLR